MNGRPHENLHDQRIDYHGDLLPLDLGAFDPWDCFASWFDRAKAEQQAGRLAEPTAMILSTATPGDDGLASPSARVVLLKEYDERGLVFFTHDDSTKGRAIAENPHVSLLFWWPSLMRQIRVEGEARKVDRAESEAYFASRPRGSQIGAWASEQSAPLASREALVEAVAEAELRFENAPVPCPQGWGGYRVAPGLFEFWQGQPSRLHDRVRVTRESATDESWLATRLQP